MKTQRFPTRSDAERYLAAQGYRFQGAPSRWRKPLPGRVLYAAVVQRGHAAIVVFTDPKDAPQA
ncbi:hypothetical protein [Azospirillum sp.]|uniref:hypothetical protein n=1 Tax=Azospirillum sp. TaxID=34012 RepID=UPI002D2CDA84|nr:hypothetical protein [Azospirillum sp.]HYD65125.1 hypothetical protein [Azospirillum sp.]